MGEVWLDIGICNIHTAFLGPQLWDKVKMFNSEVAGAGGWSGGEAAYSSSDHSNSPTQFQQVNYPKLILNIFHSLSAFANQNDHILILLLAKIS